VRPFLRSGDFWSGLALAALGAWILVQARGWAYTGEDGPGAGFFPMWYGGAMVVLSLALVAGSVLKPSARGGVRWNEVGRALACWAAFAAAVALMPFAGFVVSFALLAAFIVKVMCGERTRTALVVAVGFAVAFYLVFEVALDVSLPKGALF
jgi:putative tricarboxylic transport membrane protein